VMEERTRPGAKQDGITGKKQSGIIKKRENNVKESASSIGNGMVKNRESVWRKDLPIVTKKKKRKTEDEREPTKSSWV